ncbi:MAG: hypothetical protein JWO32_1691 [Bacteroidetes bacterium]|nr:hypothetical protein [Bacteroidota bacterium]
MKKCIYLVLVTFLFSCNNNDGNGAHKENQDSLNNNGNFEASFDHKLFKPLALPLLIDTNFILEVDTNERIPYQQVRQLGTHFLETEMSASLAYDINTFCEIDSLKHAGAYEEYLEKLDAGMTKISISFKSGVIDLKNGAKLFIWGIHNSSYEACPYFAGTTIIATFMNSEKKNTHFVIGEISGGGDPPATGHDEVTARIDENGIATIKSISINDDIDLPGEEKTIQSLLIKLTKDKIEILDSKKETKNTEKARK